MEKYISKLKNVQLFKDASEDDILEMLGCLSADVKNYEKNEMIFAAGDAVYQVGIVLTGTVHVFTDDFMGNRTILAALTDEDLFAEAFACAGVKRIPVSVMAVTKCEIMLINYRKIVSGGHSCAFQNKLIRNMLEIVAAKNVNLSQKLDIISKRSTREKLTAYLSAQSIRAGSNEFIIPFDRQGLADFLCVERSAMSAELSKMQREGLLKTTRSRFVIAQDI